MFKKIKKLGKNAAEKIESSANKAKNAATHKIHSKRGHTSLRDLMTDGTEQARLLEKLFVQHKEVTALLIRFLHEFCVFPMENVQAFTSHSDNLMVTVQETGPLLKVWTSHMQNILRAEEEAAKAAKQQQQPVNKATLLPVKKENLQLSFRDFAGAHIQLFQKAEEVSRTCVDLLASMPEAPAAHVPFEELWDEARPAVGAAVQQAAPNPDGTKKSFSDQLASFPRPVDGDTRAKYAKEWNDEVTDAVDIFRKLDVKINEWIMKLGQTTNYFSEWVKEEGEGNESFQRTALVFETLLNQFANVHLLEYRNTMESFYRIVEQHTAPVPMKGQPALPIDPSIPKRRQAEMKGAATSALQAIATFMLRALHEVSMFGEAIQGTI